MSTVERVGVWWFVIAALVAIPLSGPALAGESEGGVTARLAALTSALAEHKRAKDASGLTNDVKQLVQLYADAARHAKARTQAVRLLGGLSRSRSGSVAEAALAALGRTADPQGARYVAAHLVRKHRAGKVPATLRAAVAAAAKIHADSLVGPLLKIVSESKDFALASAAVKALGYFGSSKRKREVILRTLVETVAKDRPGLKGRRKGYVEGDQYRHTGDLARNRWDALSRALPAALARLTGQEINGANAVTWIDLVNEHKRKLGSLFVDRS